MTEVTPSLESLFSLLRDLFKLQPRRKYALFERSIHRVLVASDASYENGVGKARFLLVSDPDRPGEIRVGRVIDIPSELYSIWGCQKT